MITPTGSGRVDWDAYSWGSRNPKDIDRFLKEANREGARIVFQDCKTKEVWLATFSQKEVKRIPLTLDSPSLLDSEEAMPCTASHQEKLIALKELRVSTPEEIKLSLERQLHAAEKSQNREENDAVFTQMMVSRRKLGYNFTSTRRDPPGLSTMASPIQVGNLQVGISCCRGGRPEMQDAHLVTELSLLIEGKEYKMNLLGVFDGHKGAACSQFLKDNLVERLKARLLHHNPKELTEAGIYMALKLVMTDLDREFKATRGLAGSTATVILLMQNAQEEIDIFCANTGDSRAFLEEEGLSRPLSRDAKPLDPDFAKGITARGGFVSNGRVLGKLAMTRAVRGDHSLRRIVSARPKVVKRTLPSPPPGSRLRRRLFLASDGFFCVASSAQTARELPHMAQAGKRPHEMSEQFLRGAVAAGSTDNITIIVAEV